MEAIAQSIIELEQSRNLHIPPRLGAADLRDVHARAVSEHPLRNPAFASQLSEASAILANPTKRPAWFKIHFIYTGLPLQKFPAGCQWNMKKAAPIRQAKPAA